MQRARKRVIGAVLRDCVRWLVVWGLALAACAQSTPMTPPVPSDPLELATGQIRVARGRSSRAASVGLLDRARTAYAWRAAGRAYDLKVTFTVDSGGQTQYDGAWQMEDIFDPRQGWRWTAQSASYTITRIFSQGMAYGEQTGDYIPLRLQEARAALFDPMPSARNVSRASLRKTTTVFHGAQLTCVLLSRRGASAPVSSGRRWDETEECIDPHSGLLAVHSQVPGRYYAYDYSNAPKFGGLVLPRKVTITEAGRIVTQISVDSLTGMPAADGGLFVASAEMVAKGRPVAMSGAEKIWIGPSVRGVAADVVCVFGVVTPSGNLVEAHSLQPLDPNSQAAVAQAAQMHFSRPAPAEANPEQHFAFILERFANSH